MPSPWPSAVDFQAPPIAREVDRAAEHARGRGLLVQDAPRSRRAGARAPEDDPAERQELQGQRQIGREVELQGRS